MRTRGSTQEREQRRIRAMQLYQEGWDNEQIAQALQVTPRSVRRWKQAYRHGGERALAGHKPAGRPPYLDGRQRRDLQRRLLQGALANGFASDLWTGKRVAQLIQRRYHVQYAVKSMSEYLRHLGFTPQRPARRARERDEAAIRRWTQRDWPAIKKKGGSTARLPGVPG